MLAPYDDKVYPEVFGGFYRVMLEQHPEVSADAAATAAVTMMLVSRADVVGRQLAMLNDNLGKLFADMKLIVGMEQVEPGEHDDWEAPF